MESNIINNNSIIEDIKGDTFFENSDILKPHFGNEDTYYLWNESVKSKVELLSNLSNLTDNSLCTIVKTREEFEKSIVFDNNDLFNISTYKYYDKFIDLLSKSNFFIIAIKLSDKYYKYLIKEELYYLDVILRYYKLIFTDVCIDITKSYISSHVNINDDFGDIIKNMPYIMSLPEDFDISNIFINRIEITKIYDSINLINNYNILSNLINVNNVNNLFNEITQETTKLNNLIINYNKLCNDYKIVDKKFSLIEHIKNKTSNIYRTLEPLKMDIGINDFVVVYHNLFKTLSLLNIDIIRLSCLPEVKIIKKINGEEYNYLINNFKNDIETYTDSEYGPDIVNFIDKCLEENKLNKLNENITQYIKNNFIITNNLEDKIIFNDIVKNFNGFNEHITNEQITKDLKSLGLNKYLCDGIIYWTGLKMKNDKITDLGVFTHNVFPKTEDMIKYGNILMDRKGVENIQKN